MNFNIRSMTECDIDFVYEIEQSVHLAPWSRGILSDCVRVGYDCRVLEITNNDRTMTAGYIICRYSENSCHILNFCIAQELQEKGYGRALLQNLLYSLSAHGFIEHVVLEVRPSNKRALHLYQTLGFEQVEIKPGYYKDAHGVEDAIFLKKEMRGA